MPLPLRTATHPARGGPLPRRRLRGGRQAFSDDDGADGPYNLGNALARAGRLHEALEAYDAALERHPEDADARHNRDLVADLLERQNAAGAGPSPPGSAGSRQPTDDGEREAAFADGGQGAPEPGRDAARGDSLDPAGAEATAGTDADAPDADAAAAAGDAAGEQGDESAANPRKRVDRPRARWATPPRKRVSPHRRPRTKATRSHVRPSSSGCARCRTIPRDCCGASSFTSTGCARERAEMIQRKAMLRIVRMRIVLATWPCLQASRPWCRATR
ncbi:MAG: tetratricopeptide repeat protein [Gammaproteobacteria bacterium]|nr:tetratricopeptide repeat protein [Gammaproteobacteria bacterium]